MEESGKEQTKVKSLALRDAIDLLSGKWRFCIIQNLFNNGSMHFKDLQKTIQGISPKVLSKELKELEENKLVERVVNDTKPVTVSYSPTQHAIQTQPVITALMDFGFKHRKEIKGK